MNSSQNPEVLTLEDQAKQLLKEVDEVNIQKKLSIFFSMGGTVTQRIQVIKSNPHSFMAAPFTTYLFHAACLEGNFPLIKGLNERFSSLNGDACILNITDEHNNPPLYYVWQQSNNEKPLRHLLEISQQIIFPQTNVSPTIVAPSVELRAADTSLALPPAAEAKQAGSGVREDFLRLNGKYILLLILRQAKNDPWNKEFAEKLLDLSSPLINTGFVDHRYYLLKPAKSQIPTPAWMHDSACYWALCHDYSDIAFKLLQAEADLEFEYLNPSHFRNFVYCLFRDKASSMDKAGFYALSKNMQKMLLVCRAELLRISFPKECTGNDSDVMGFRDDPLAYLNRWAYFFDDNSLFRHLFNVSINKLLTTFSYVGEECCNLNAQVLERELIDAILQFAASNEETNESKSANFLLNQDAVRSRVTNHIDENKRTALDRALQNSQISGCVKLLKLGVTLSGKQAIVKKEDACGLIRAIIEEKEEKETIDLWNKIIFDSSDSAFFNQFQKFYTAIKELINEKMILLPLMQKISLLIFCLFDPDVQQADFKLSVLCLMKKKFFTRDELKNELRKALIEAAYSSQADYAAIHQLWNSGLKEKMAPQDEKDTTALDQALSHNKVQAAIRLLNLGFAYNPAKIRSTSEMASALFETVLEAKEDNAEAFVECYSSLEEVRNKSESLYLILVFYKRELLKMIKETIKKLLDNDDKIKLLEKCLQGYEPYEKEFKISEVRPKSMLCQLFGMPRNKKNNTPLYSEIIFNPNATDALGGLFNQWKALRAKQKKTSALQAGIFGKGKELVTFTTSTTGPSSPSPTS